MTAGVIGAAIGILSHASKRQDQKDAEEAGAPSDDHSYDVYPNRPRSPSHRYSHYRHPTEEEHRTAEQFSWRHAYALNIGIAVLTFVGAVFAVGTYLQAKRQADIAQRVLIASDRPFIYFSLNSVNDDNAASPDFTITNVSDRPAIITYVEIWNNDAETPAFANTPFMSCFLNLAKIAMAAGKDLSGRCFYNGHNSVTSIHHLYGVIVYSSVTGKRWRQNFDYFYNPVFKTWNSDGDPTMNREVMIDARGDELRDEAD